MATLIENWKEENSLTKLMAYLLSTGSLFLLLISGAVGIANLAHADGLHDGPHAFHDNHGGILGHHDILKIGELGNSKSAFQTISITMGEQSDGSMNFEPSSLAFKKGQTVRLSFENDGKLRHEFVMDEPSALKSKAEIMKLYPDYEHQDPNVIHLNPGEKGEIIWKFLQAGTFKFACLLPGHEEAGMHGLLTVS